VPFSKCGFFEIMTVSKTTVLYLFLLFIASFSTLLSTGEEKSSSHVHQKEQQQQMHNGTSFQFYSRFNWQNLPLLREFQLVK